MKRYGLIAGTIDTHPNGPYVKHSDLRKAQKLIRAFQDQQEWQNAAVANAYRDCAEYVLKLHLENRPKLGAIDALKTAYEYFCRKARK